VPLYLFDKDFAKKCAQLPNDYEVPKFFADDLFAVLGEEERPDYRCRFPKPMHVWMRSIPTQCWQGP
jgi:hypothetical protein